MVLKPLTSAPVAVHHGGRSEQRELAHAGRKLHQLRRLEATRQRNHMPPAAQHLGVVVEASAVRHGRGVDHGIAGQHIVHVGEVAGRHGQQIAVGLHHPLRAASGAGGVEQ